MVGQQFRGVGDEESSVEELLIVGQQFRGVVDRGSQWRGVGDQGSHP